MATITSDALYAGPFPSVSRPVHAIREYKISARWELMLPWAIIESKLHPDPPARLYFLKTRHRSRILQALDAGIHWRVIIRLALDDPRLNDAAWQFVFRPRAEQIARLRETRATGIPRIHRLTSRKMSRDSVARAQATKAARRAAGLYKKPAGRKRADPPRPALYASDPIHLD